jgi:bifunctional DNA-binding transcriptional regulator/antitoxin component of YhaV-PrlF toxin-antitoxin module
VAHQITKEMRFIISLLLLPFFALTACAQGTSGVSIPARQTFVLGEYRTDGYQATLRNQGNQVITAAIVNQKDGKTVSTVNLPAGDRQALTIADGQEVHLINGSDQVASIKVKSPVKGSQGMRYVKADGDKANTDFEANKKVALPFPTVEADEDSPSGATSGKFTLAPGERLIVGEGSSKHYNLIISNRGSSLSVSGRNKINDERMQSFGLGRFGKVNMAIRPNENLVIVNNSEKTSTVKLTMDKPVVGARVE